MFKIGLFSALVIGIMGCSYPSPVNYPSKINDGTFSRTYWDITLPNDFVVIGYSDDGILAASKRDDTGLSFKTERVDYDLETYTTIVTFNLLTKDLENLDLHGTTWAGHDGLYSSFVENNTQFYYWQTVTQGRLYRFGCAASKSSSSAKSECTNIAATIHTHPIN